MNVKSTHHQDSKLLIICLLISSAIFLNYFFWAINALSFFKYINFSILIFLISYFLVSREFKKYNFIKLFFLSLLILCLGSALTDWDARSVWLFHAKRIYIDNDLYGGFDNYMPELMNAYPLIAPSLSATLAKLIGHWNEIFPKSTNILLVLPAVLIQCFFLKDSKFKLMWLMFILLFSGRILINGRTDGLVAIYFVSCCLVIFKLFIGKNLNFLSIKNKKINRSIILVLGILFGIILTLLKNEGFVIMFIIFISTIFFKLLTKRNFSFEDLFFWIFIFLPIIIWKLMATTGGVYPRIIGFGIEAVYSESLIQRIIIRLTDLDNYKLIFDYLILNEKFIISLIIFGFAFLKNFKKNEMIFKFVIFNSIIYYFLLNFIYLSTPHDISWHLNSSAHRVLISIVLLLTYFSILSFQGKKN